MNLAGGTRALRSLREPLKLFLATRLPLLLVMYLGLVVVPLETKPGQWRMKPDNLLLDGWFRWDTGWYVQIARDGYGAVPNAEGQTDVTFWPLFPMLTRLVAKVFATDDIALVMFGLNHALLAGSTFFLYHLARKRHGADIARLATVLFLTYPYAIYYSAGYSEATFLFFALGAFYFASDERWALASVFAGIGSASRGVAFMISVGVVALYLEKRDWKLRRIRPDALWLVLGFTGVIAYTYYLQRTFHDPFAYVRSFTAKGWGADISSQRLVDTLALLFHPESWAKGIYVPDLLCLLALVFFTVMTLIAIPRVPVGETLFALGSLVVYAKMWVTAGRYVGTIFPVYITLARMLNPRPNARTAVQTTWAVVLALFAFVFGHWGWVSG